MNSFTPSVVSGLPDAVRDIVVGAYNDALTPVFASLIPMVVVGLLLVLFIKEVPLRASLDSAEAADVRTIDGTVDTSGSQPTDLSTSSVMTLVGDPEH